MVGWESDGKELKSKKLSIREKRFLQFSSVEYLGQVYMTPQDFLESVTEAEPKPMLERIKLSAIEVSAFKENTPSISVNSERFLRNIGNKGIISYAEYLFLLTILIKPRSGFKIAFSMLDEDGNNTIDRQEFKVLESIFSKAAKERNSKENRKDNVYGLGSSLDVDTSLLVHFFGVGGKGNLEFSDFYNFMENLQTEVLQVEFNKFSSGSPSISEVDLARILFRYTFLNSADYERIFKRLVEGPREKKRITFEEFEDFFKFLNNLDDFQIAMRMFTLAERPITQEEFSRAVYVCMGKLPSPHMVSIVFKIFDENGDGLLSYQEFLAVMKERKHRGIRNYSRQSGWEGFKKCVKKNMQSTSSFVKD